MKRLILLALAVLSTSALFISPPEEKDEKCPSCELVDCMEPSNCKNGVVKDSCGCCKVCLKSKSEHCGGPNSMDGVCQKNFTCVIRHPSSLRNSLLPDGSKIGRCEPDICIGIKCGRHQFCKADLDGFSTCNTCDHIACKDDFKPVCDILLGVQYNNSCEVRKAECYKQQRILTFPTPCPKCVYNGMEYKNNELVTMDGLCEKATCRNGELVRYMDKDCLKSAQFTCTSGSKRHDDISCSNGFFCKVFEKADGKGDFPHLGKCVLLDPAEICKLPPVAGPCYALFRRWYYNNTYNKCMRFDYGGCHGNGNNFETAHECNRACYKKGSKMITIKGHINFPRTPGRLPSPSCLHVTFADVSVMDAAQVMLATVSLDVSNSNIKNYFDYMIDSKKPVDSELWRDFSISAVLNVGWCPGDDSDSWVRSGDFLTDTTHRVQLTKEKDLYTIDINVICYECKEAKPPLPEVIPQPAAHDIINTTNIENSTVVLPVIPAAPVAGDKPMEVYGFITFNKIPGKLPNGSCLKYALTDSTLLDGPVVVLEKRTVPVGGKVFGKQYKYSLILNRPKDAELDRRYTLIAVLNVGWCSSTLSEKWIRDGDYTNTVEHVVKLKKDVDTYYSVVNASYYCTNCMDKKLARRSDLCKVSINETYTDGETWEVDSCTSCLCQKGEAVCTTIDCPILVCENSIRKPGECCPRCPPKTCLEKTTGEVYNEGESWQRDDCTRCQCFNGNVACTIVHCHNAFCINPIFKRGQCCPECLPETCFEQTTNQTYNSGDRWNRDPCTSCYCDFGRSRCSVAECGYQYCASLVVIPGECCAECLPSKCFDRSMTRFYKEGEIWVESDACTRCMCLGGEPMCASPVCEFPSCPRGIEVVNVSGICCPVCSHRTICRDNNTQAAYVEGRIWQRDDCKLCKCTEDGITCQQPNTLPIDCKRKVWLNRSCRRICLPGKKLKIPLTGTDEPEKDDDVVRFDNP